MITFSWITLSFSSSVVGFVWLAHRGSLAARRHAAGADAVVMLIYNEAPSRVSAHACHLTTTSNAPARPMRSTSFSSPTPLTPMSGSREERVSGDARAVAAGAPLLPAAAEEFEPRRWQHRRFRHPLGRPYPHMVVFDADSLMTGSDRDSAAATWRRTPTPESSKACRSSSTATRCSRARSSSPPGSPARSSPRA